MAYNKTIPDEVFESDDHWGIPIVYKDPDIGYNEEAFEVYGCPPALVPFEGSSTKVIDAEIGGRNGVHFFLDDFRFERIILDPEKYDKTLSNADVLLTPDFSLYINMPRAVQVFNVFRNRWMGAYWQRQGLHVIPTIAWSDMESFEYAFCGVELNATVAVSTVGPAKRLDTRQGFEDGFHAMVNILEPNLVVVYGKLWFEPEVPVQVYAREPHPIHRRGPDPAPFPDNGALWLLDGGDNK